MRVAFVVDEFPVTSQTFIINQVADLLDRGVEVEIFAFRRGHSDFVSSSYDAYKMSARLHYLQPPKSRIRKLTRAITLMARILLSHPSVLVRALNFLRYRKMAWSLKLLFRVAPFLRKEFDIVHCHFGDCANRFLIIKDVLQLKVPLVTTFYGYDVSQLFNQKQSDYYERLKHESALFLVMSHDMKRRVVEWGFPENKVRVHPVSINVGTYPFSERKRTQDQPVELLFVGRFVEKKGVDDLIRALAIVQEKTQRAFRCTIVGGGHQEQEIKKLVSTCRLEDRVHFRGFMKIEEIIELMPQMHLMVQPSKTAANGDME